MITSDEGGLPQAALDGIIRTLSGFPGLERAILYGSLAMGTHRPGSDIDLPLSGNLSYSDLLLIETALDDLMLPHKIDLSLHHQIDNPQLLDHIQRVGKPLYTPPPS